MQNERRRFPRIPEMVLMRTRKVENTQLEQKLVHFKQDRNRLSSSASLNLNLVEQIADLDAIEEKMPELARYLINLQRQVDRLSNAVFTDETQPRKQEKQVVLSAQGIDFFTDDLYQPVDVVELVLQLNSCTDEMLIYGRVIIVDDNDSDIDQGRFRVALDFEHILDSDRETLIDHVNYRQQTRTSQLQATP